MNNKLTYIETKDRNYPIVFNINVMEEIQEAYGSIGAWGAIVENADGESVPLSAFASVKDTIGVEYITLFNLNESISLTVTPSAKASTGDVMKIITSVADKNLPDDVGYAWSGTSYQEAKSSRGGAMVYLLALIFVFLALAALYNSWGLPLAGNSYPHRRDIHCKRRCCLILLLW